MAWPPPEWELEYPAAAPGALPVTGEQVVPEDPFLADMAGGHAAAPPSVPPGAAPVDDDDFLAAMHAPTGALSPEPSLIDEQLRAPEVDSYALEGAPPIGLPEELDYSTPSAAFGLEQPTDIRPGDMQRERYDGLTENERIGEDALTLHARGPVYRAAHERIAEKEQADFVAQRLAEARQANLEEQARLQEDMERINTQAEKDRQELRQRWTALAEEGVDPDRWWESRSTGQKVAAGIAAVIGGYLSAGRGPNQGLAMITDAIDRDIDAQKANLGAKRDALRAEEGIVAQLVQQGMTQYQAGEAARIAGYQDAINQVAEEAQQFDLNGTTYRRIAKDMADAEQLQAEAEQRYLEERRKAYVEDRKYALDKWKAEEAADVASRAVGVQEGQLGLARRKDAREADAAAQSPSGEQIDPELRVVAGFGPDGQRIEAAALSKDDAKELKRRKTQTDKVALIGSKLIDLRKKHGMTLDVKNTEANNRMRQLAEQMNLELAELHDVPFSDRTKDALAEMIGGDPTVLLDSTDFIQQAVDSANENYQIDVRNRTNYEGPDIPATNIGTAPPPSFDESFRTLNTDATAAGWVPADERIAAGKALAEEAIRGDEHRASTVINLRNALAAEKPKLEADEQIVADSTGRTKAQALNRVQDRRKVVEWLESEIESLSKPELSPPASVQAWDALDKDMEPLRRRQERRR